jgi:hypothetical protein
MGAPFLSCRDSRGAERISMVDQTRECGVRNGVAFRFQPDNPTRCAPWHRPICGNRLPADCPYAGLSVPTAHYEARKPVGMGVSDVEWFAQLPRGGHRRPKTFSPCATLLARSST